MSGHRGLDGALVVPGVALLAGLSTLLVHRIPTVVGLVVLAIGVLATGATLARGYLRHRRATRPSARVVWMRAAVGVSGGLLIIGLLVGLTGPGRAAASLELMAAGAASAVVLFAPTLARSIRRAAGGLLGLGLLATAIAAIAWLGIGAQIGPGGLWLPIAVFAFGTGGVFLLAVALGVGHARVPAVGFAGERRPGRAVRRSGHLWRAGLGTLMVLWAIGLAMALAEAHVTQHPALVTVSALAVVAAAVLVIGTPLSITSYVARRRLAVERTREAERRRIAAHLHDSVLQTLALVQRQAADASAVTRLARRQEVALRAWMSGEGELSPGSLRAALQAVVQEVEDADEVSIELSMVGDRPIQPDDQALLGAVGEALRNVTRHARGSPATVFTDVGDEVTEVFVSDAGPGFDLAAIPDDRHGIRESIVARMAAVGGIAEITTSPGQGTDVLLRLPAT